MNNFKLKIGIDNDDNYINAKCKLMDFAEEWNKLTSEQRTKLVNEFTQSIIIADSMEEFIKHMNNGGQA